MRYSVYKGDEEIAFGTIKEIADKLGIKQESVKFYGTESYKKRTKKNGRCLIKC